MILLILLATLPLRAQSSAQPVECVERLEEDFVPLTRSERLAEGIRSITGPNALVFSGVRAGIGQADSRPPDWGQGAGGFTRRFASSYGELFVGQTAQHVSALALHEDDRYFASGGHGAWRRFGYAIASTLLARRDDGSRTIAISALGGAAAGSFVTQAWQSRTNGYLADGAVSFGLTMGVRAGFNLLREFSPRLATRLLP